jgi:Phosphoserine phosphatase RsbU, N-terminal domain
VDDQLGTLAAGYQAGLQPFMDVGDEAELEAPHAFSQAAFRAERTVLDVVDMHNRAVQELSGRAASSDPTLTAAGFTYLAEALSTFEMTQRSYWEAKRIVAVGHGRPSSSGRPSWSCSSRRVRSRATTVGISQCSPRAPSALGGARC